MASPEEFFPAQYRDRKTGLVVIGILAVLMGGFCGLLVLTLLGQSKSVNSGVEQIPASVLPAIVSYCELGMILILLGIGSMMARRWARALLLIFSWSWLVIGVITTGAVVFMLPRIIDAAQSGAPPGQDSTSAATAVTLIVIGVFNVMFVLLPTIWIFFYGSKHVKATCEANDPAGCWTDRCPLPVLAVSFWMAFGVPSMLMMAVIHHGAIPVFGAFVSGPLGSALYVVIAIVWGYAAWALYKLNRLGWWIIVSGLILFSISAFLTYSHHDLKELYTLMGYPQAEIDLIQKHGLMNGQVMAWCTLGGTVPLLGYMLYIRRFLAEPN